MIAPLIVLLCAALNRLRGDDSWKPSWLPGRALFYVTPAIGAVALIFHGWMVAAAFAAGYLFWAVFSWGYPLAALGGLTPARAPDALETLLMRLGTPWAALARMLFVMPGAALVAWLMGAPLMLLAGAGFAVGATIAYWLFMKSPDEYDWMRSEVATGALWGLLIVGSTLLV